MAAKKAAAARPRSQIPTNTDLLEQQTQQRNASHVATLPGYTVTQIARLRNLGMIKRSVILVVSPHLMIRRIWAEFNDANFLSRYRKYLGR